MVAKCVDRATPHRRTDPHPALARQPRELVQLAGEWRGGLREHGSWVEEKMEGVRAAWIGGQLLTREGTPIGGIGHIAWRLSRIERAAGRALFFDGEFIAPGGFQATLRHIGQGERAPEQGTLHLFDCLSATEWAADNCDRPLYQRKQMLRDLVALDDGLSWEWRPGTRGREPIGPAIEIVSDTWVETQADAERLAHEIWSRGGEGIMLKDAEAPYRRARFEAWRKYKQRGWSTKRVA